MDDNLVALLRDGAAALGRDLSETEVTRYIKYLRILLEWNEKINLTAIKEPEQVIIKHFLDSLAIIPWLNETSGLRLLDVGTGAGFPGIPLKIACPEIEVVLLDSLNKRVSFLNHLISELGLTGITALHGRAEDLGHQQGFRESFDLVTSRAVANLAVLAELCLPFAKVGGRFIAYKGPRIKEEIDEGLTAIETLGGKISQEAKVEINGLEEQRTLVFIDKTGLTPDKYPRKAGIPEKRPLK